MILKKIHLQNIRSYEEQEIEFPKGSLLLAGDVGAGKTSLLMAIEYALFGLQPGQNSAGLLRNKAIGGAVNLLLEIEGNEVLIERKLKRGSKSIANEYAAITINGKKHECSVTELKTHVLKLLGYPSEFVKKNNLLYRYTVYTPQEQMKQIINEDPEARLSILRHTFGIDKYKLIRENTQKILIYLREDAKVFQAQIRAFDQEIHRITDIEKNIIHIESQSIQEQESLRKKVEERKEKEKEVLDLREKSKEKEKLESEIEKVKVMTASKREALLHLEKEYGELQRTITETRPFSEIAFTKVEESLQIKRASVTKLQERHIQVKSQIHALEQQQREAKSKKERIFTIDLCPTCLQDIPDAHKHNVLHATEQTLTALQRQREALQEEEKQVFQVLEHEQKEFQMLEHEKTQQEILRSKAQYVALAQKKSQEIIKSKESLTADIALLDRHREAVREDLARFSRFINLLKAKEEELRQAFLQEKRNEIHLAEIRKEQELLKKEMERMKEIIQQRELIQKNLTQTLEVTEWLSQYFLSLMSFTESSVLMKLRTEFSKLFSKWFHMLASDSFEVQIDETFTPIVVQGGQEMEYVFLSGGERTAVALAYRLALNQTINSVLSQIKTRDIIILDEPTEGFSETQLERMREVLAELQVQQLIIVSHEQKIEGFVEQVIKLKKEEGISVRE